MEVLKSAINGTLSAGTESFGNWQTYAGGRETTPTTTTRTPGARYSRPIPGVGSIENVTLSRDYDPDRDGPAEERLRQLRGGQTVFTVGRVIRDGAGNIIRTDTRVGILLDVMGPEGDVNDETGKPTLEVVLGIAG